MTVTVTDLFCGAGGSTLGAAAVDGVAVRIAANHWQRAIDTHAANVPAVEHDCADISQIDPRRYPPTDVLWASPECTNHSGATGRRRPPTQPDLFGDTLPEAAGERSRATMWDVARFAEHHRYRVVVVENVVEAARWVLWPAWLHAMTALGYRHRVVYLNSMHAPAATGLRAPQSRDRLYVVFWRAGQPAPDLELRPPAWCGGCGQVISAVQAWKRPDLPGWGRYRAQYHYRCPHAQCRHAVVEPDTDPASVAIDWALPGQRIGDRTRPLADKTMARIRAGLARYTGALAVPAEGRQGTAAAPVMVIPHPVAFIAELRGGGSHAREVSEPLATVTASGNHHMLVRHPPATIGHAPPAARPEQMPDVADCTFRMLEPSEIQAAMAFPPAYRVLGTRREQVRQLGNAVTPPAAQWLIAAVVASLTGPP